MSAYLLFHRGIHDCVEHDLFFLVWNRSPALRGTHDVLYTDHIFSVSPSLPAGVACKPYRPMRCRWTWVAASHKPPDHTAGPHSAPFSSSPCLHSCPECGDVENKGQVKGSQGTVLQEPEQLVTSKNPIFQTPNLQYILIFISVFLFVYWSMIASMCGVSFCCTMKWISSKYTNITSLLRIPHTPPLDHWALSWAPCAIHQPPTS